MQKNIQYRAKIILNIMPKEMWNMAQKKYDSAEENIKYGVETVLNMMQKLSLKYGFRF